MSSSRSEDVDSKIYVDSDSNYVSNCDGYNNVKDNNYEEIPRDNYIEPLSANSEQSTSSEGETGTVILFLDRWIDQILGVFSSAFNIVNKTFVKSSIAASPAASAYASAASAATKEMIAKQREEEVPLEPFISNPFLMNVCHLRAILNEFRKD